MLINSNCGTRYVINPGEFKVEGNSSYVDTLVIHDMSNVNFSHWMSTIPSNVPYPFPNYYYQQPQYLNYVTHGGITYELAPVGYSVRGIDTYYNNTVSPSSPSSLANDGLVHVGLFSGENAISIELICCILKLNPNISRIVPSFDIDNRRPNFALTTAAMTYISDCSQKESDGDCCTCGQCQECLTAEDLTCQCTEEIAVLQDQINTHTHPDLEALIAGLENRIVFLEACCQSNIDSINDQQSEIDNLSSQVNNLNSTIGNLILDISECCGSSLRCIEEPYSLPLCVDANILPSDSVEIPGGSSNWLEFGDIIIGEELVNVGPLWTAGTENSSCTVDISLSWDDLTWCDGSVAELYILACNDRILVDTKSDGATLSGSVIVNIPVGCQGLHAEVFHNDEITHQIIEANIKVCCNSTT